MNGWVGLVRRKMHVCAENHSLEFSIPMSCIILHNNKFVKTTGQVYFPTLQIANHIHRLILGYLKFQMGKVAK